MFLFHVATRNTYKITVDGTDEAEFEQWIFTSTTERVYVPSDLTTDSHRNCLQIISADMLARTSCRYEAGRSVFCESEGNYSRLYTSYRKILILQ